MIAERDNKGSRRLFVPEIEWTQTKGFPRGGRYVGSGVREQWEGWKVVVKRYLDAGESVVALGVYEGTHLNIGRFVRVEFTRLIEFEDGRIVRFVHYTDTLEVAEAMGIVQKEPI